MAMQPTNTRSKSAAAKRAAPARAPRKAARPGRPQKNNGDVRGRVLDVAEELFAKHGFDGVSTRVIARRAGATSAMIHYYFDSKRALFDAVVARRADVLNEERVTALDNYEARAGDAVTVEGALEAFLGPVLAKLESGGEGWRHYLSLIAQVGNNHEWGGEVMNRSFDPVVQRLIEVIKKALPSAKDADLYWAYNFLSGALTLTCSETGRIDRLSNGICRSTDIPEIAPRMIAFAAAGFRRVCG